MKCEFKSNVWEVIDANIGVFFEVVNETNKALERIYTNEKEEFRRMLFVFWWLIKLFETRVSPKDHANFQLFYKEFYQDFPFLRYKVEEAYNIKSKDFFPIFLKVKVNNKLVKKDW